MGQTGLIKEKSRGWVKGRMKTENKYDFFTRKEER